MNASRDIRKLTAALILCAGILALLPCAGAAETGSDSVTITGYILPRIEPVADFSANPLTGPVPLTVQFIDRSTGSPAEWAWDFNGDGTIDSTAQNPSFTYIVPGTFTVSLRVANAAGSDTETKAGLITVTSPDPAPRIAALRAYVDSLPVMGWAKWYLDVPLRNAAKHIEKDNEVAAVNQLRSFTDNVGTLRWLGIISETEAEYMTAAAAAISALILA
jgi:PKD repeat protein